MDKPVKLAVIPMEIDEPIVTGKVSTVDSDTSESMGKRWTGRSLRKKYSPARRIEVYDETKNDSSSEKSTKADFKSNHFEIDTVKVSSRKMTQRSEKLSSSSSSFSPRLIAKLPSDQYHREVFSASKKDVNDSPVRSDKATESRLKRFSPNSPLTSLKEIKLKGITMYIWLDLLNSFLPEAVKAMKGDKELYKRAKSAVKKFLTDNYPSIGLSFEEMDNQKILYIPKPFEVTFKSWFKEEFASGFKCLDIVTDQNSEKINHETCLKNQENVSAVKQESDADDNILINEGLCIPGNSVKKSKSNVIRYNMY